MIMNVTGSKPDRNYAGDATTDQIYERKSNFQKFEFSSREKKPGTSDRKLKL